MNTNTKKNNNTPLFYTDLVDMHSYHAVLVRSSFSSGTINSISLENIPENYSLFTADNLTKEQNIVVLDTSFPIFAKNKISYKGEPIGILVGPDLTVINELLPQINVNFTETILTENEANNDFTKIVAKKNISYNETENIDELIFKNITSQYSLALKIEESSEPNGAYCTFSNKTLTVNTPTQWLSNLRENIEAVIELKSENILVNKTSIPITEKNSPWHNTIIATQCAIASFLTKKNVLLMLTTEEQNEYNDSQNKITINHNSNIAENGALLGCDVIIDVDIGAYNPFAVAITERLAITALGAYTSRKFNIEVVAHTSPNPPATSLLRWLDYHCFFAIESHLRVIAKETGLNSAQVRLNNIYTKKNDYPFQFDTETYKKIIEIAVQKSDFNRKYATYMLNPYTKKSKNLNFPIRGIGMATAFEGNGFYGSTLDLSSQSVEVTMEKDSHVIIKVLNESNAIASMLKEIAASILSVETSDITIDNDFLINEKINLPESMLTNMYISSQLIIKACTAVQKQRFREALPISAKRKLTKSNKKVWNNITFSGKPFFATSWIAVVAEIELDTATYAYNVKNIWISIEAGNILSKKMARYAIQNCVKQLLANILKNQNFVEPNISITFLESNVPPKQIRELVYSTLPSAIANALSQILQQTLNTFPINQETVFQKISEIIKEDKIDEDQTNIE